MGALYLKKLMIADDQNTQAFAANVNIDLKHIFAFGSSSQA
jgi:hypothetical protein